MAGSVTLNQHELAERLGVTTKTLSNWRSNPSRPGPPFRRYGKKILYPIPELEAWEASTLYRTTRDYGRHAA